MEQYITIEGQSILDLSNLLYGNSSNLVKLVQDNPGIGFIGKTIPAGTVILYEKQKGNQVTDFYINRRVEPGTRDITNPLQGSGFSSGFKINGFN